MADIELRFHRDMLVLSAPADETLERQGALAARDRQYLNLIEPDVMVEALRLELAAGAQCLVTTTEDITRARLAHLNMEGDAPRLAAAALDIAAQLKPQHVLVEIGSCGLPLDASSKASLNENRAQYADAARAFGDEGFDAFFLNGFTNLADLKCALMGVAQVSGKPVFASVTVGVSDAKPAGAAAGKPSGTATRSSDESVLQGIASSYPIPTGGFELVDDVPAPPAPVAGKSSLDPSRLREAADIMVDLGVAVVGFETADPIALAEDYARTLVECVELPVLAQLRVTEGSLAAVKATKGLVPLDAMDVYTPGTLEHAAVRLYGAGVQFLRATGAATPSCTGALAATVMGLDVRR